MTRQIDFSAVLDDQTELCKHWGLAEGAGGTGIVRPIHPSGSEWQHLERYVIIICNADVLWIMESHQHGYEPRL